MLLSLKLLYKWLLLTKSDIMLDKLTSSQKIGIGGAITMLGMGLAYYLEPSLVTILMEIGGIGIMAYFATGVKN